MCATSCAVGIHEEIIALSGKRVRLSGLLARTARGLLLTTSNGEIFAIETEDEVVALIDQQVIIDGTMTADERLHADWIGPAQRRV